jgi:hypothetical protein
VLYLVMGLAQAVMLCLKQGRVLGLILVLCLRKMILRVPL